MQNPIEKEFAVQVLGPAATGSERTSEYVSLKNYAGAVVTVDLTQGAANTQAITLRQATAVAGTGAKAGPAVPLYANQDVATSPVLVRQADANTFTTSAATTRKRVQFFVRAAALDTNAGFDCIGVVLGASNAANITAVDIRLCGADYQEAVLPNPRID